MDDYKAVIRDDQYRFGRDDIVGHLVTVKTRGISPWGADCTCGWSALARDEDVETAAARHLDELAVVPVEELRSRIAALEAVIEEVREAAREDASNGELFYSTYHVDHALALDTSTVLDGMIREAKAEAWDEGFSAAEEDVDEHNRTSWSAPCIITNPYRSSKEGHA